MRKNWIMVMVCFLLLIFCSTGFACNYKAEKEVILEAGRQESLLAGAVADFSEGGRSVRFVVRRKNGEDRLVCEQPGITRVPWDTKDKVYGYHAYTVKKLRDASSRRVYYAILSRYAGNITNKGYLLGFDPETRKFRPYVDSHSLAVGDCGNVDFEAANGKLYLCYFEEGGYHKYFRLNWDSETQGFDCVRVQEVGD